MKVSKQFLISFLILASAGVFLRTLSHGEKIPLRKNFVDFPLKFDQWSGKEFGLKADVLKILKADDFMMRQYWNDAGMSIGLYVGYYNSQRQGATYHSPKNCLPGSGWSFLETGTTRLGILDREGRLMEINQFMIQKGSEKQWVLYWYQDRGRVIANEYWAKFYLMWDAMTQNRTDGALVRVTVPFQEENEARMLTEGRRFVEKIFPSLQDYLPS